MYPLPRGGVPLGVEVARALGMSLDLVIPRKVGHPMQPEYAIAAVGETVEPVVNQQEVARVDPEWFAGEVERQRQEARRRHSTYLGGREPVPVKGKVAILVDDGIATGLTMRAAIAEIKTREPSRVVVAVPVVPEETARQLANVVDEVVAVKVDPHYLGAVGAYYDSFPQLADQDVIDLLAEWVKTE